MDTSKADAPATSIPVVNPYLIIYKDGLNRNVCRIHPPAGSTHEHYGMLICDIVRHVSRAFEVNEEAVWEWVERERRNPTTAITVQRDLK